MSEYFNNKVADFGRYIKSVKPFRSKMLSIVHELKVQESLHVNFSEAFSFHFSTPYMSGNGRLTVGFAEAVQFTVEQTEHQLRLTDGTLSIGFSESVELDAILAYDPKYLISTLYGQDLNDPSNAITASWSALSGAEIPKSEAKERMGMGSYSLTAGTINVVISYIAQQITGDVVGLSATALISGDLNAVIAYKTTDTIGDVAALSAISLTSGELTEVIHYVAASPATTDVMIASGPYTLLSGELFNV